MSGNIGHASDHVNMRWTLLPCLLGHELMGYLDVFCQSDITIAVSCLVPLWSQVWRVVRVGWGRGAVWAVGWVGLVN